MGRCLAAADSGEVSIETNPGDVLRKCLRPLSTMRDENIFLPKILVSSLTLLWEPNQVLLILKTLSTKVRTRFNL